MMNRRNAIKAAAAGVVAAVPALDGTTVDAMHVEAGKKPPLLVLTPKSHISQQAVENIRRQFTEAAKGTSAEGCKVVVLQPGDKLEILSDDRPTRMPSDNADGLDGIRGNCNGEWKVWWAGQWRYEHETWIF